MKLPLTDKFLWKMYQILEIGEEMLDSLIWSRRKLLFPHIHQLQRMYLKEKRKRSFSQFLNYLKRKGYIEIESLKGKKAILLTKEGLKKIMKIEAKLKKKRKRKDKKMIMLIFDVPEKKRYLRERMRRLLFPLGYRVFQKSVWICPFDVLEETKRILRNENLDPYVQLFLIEKIT